jgi:multidrug efflux pump subunit AcrA (membrane-fusion protein)
VLLTVVLVGKKKPPTRAEITERALQVDVQPVHIEDVPVMISGFGQARARDEVAISPEVSGRVLRIHPQLEAGGIIRAGEEMFAIDPRDYEARLIDAEAATRQWESAIGRIERQFETDKGRLENYERIKVLAKRDFDKAVKLFEQESIESETFAGNKEATYRQAADAYDQIRQTLDLYPMRIEEARSSLTSATAARDMARFNLDRTIVRAPFDARVKKVNIEANQMVSPGSPAVTLADDSVLEMSVALNGSDARQWLQFEEGQPAEGRAWFGKVKPVPVEVAWTEALESNQWRGTLDRVERFDEETRTITVIVRVPGAEASAPRAGNLPLVEGMFCRVRIPGRVAKGVARLAAETVGFDQDATGRRTVYVARKDPDSGRATLESRFVHASHADGNFVYISDGLSEGELVITTRMVNPLENTLLDVQESVSGEAAPGAPAGS